MIIHLLSFDFDGKAFCGLGGRITTTMNHNQVTCKDCTDKYAGLLK